MCCVPNRKLMNNITGLEPHTTPCLLPCFVPNSHGSDVFWLDFAVAPALQSCHGIVEFPLPATPIMAHAFNTRCRFPDLEGCPHVAFVQSSSELAQLDLHVGVSLAAPIVLPKRQHREKSACRALVAPLKQHLSISSWIWLAAPNVVSAC